MKIDMQKISLVTGGRRGIGLAIAQKLASEGYKTIICATADITETAELLKENPTLEYIKCDVSKRYDRESLICEITGRYERIDCLVNCAGVAPLERRDILEMTEESFDRVMDINLKGTFFLTQSVSNYMIDLLKKDTENYKPRIINIGSISAYTSSVTRGEYCISKAGVSMITSLFADRLAAEGIPVFEIRPGIIQTDMTAGVIEKYQNLIDNGLTPIKRLGQPQDVADCVWAAASGLLDFATGQIINADGGFHLRRL